MQEKLTGIQSEEDWGYGISDVGVWDISDGFYCVDAWTDR